MHNAEPSLVYLQTNEAKLPRCAVASTFRAGQLFCYVLPLPNGHVRDKLWYVAVPW